jgi:hypothetical protein
LGKFFAINGLGYILGDFFSPPHLVALLSAHVRQFQGPQKIDLATLPTDVGSRNSGLQGCQIFPDTTYQKRGKMYQITCKLKLT